jgi:3-oxoacyl-[acyl-carrier protein] reductase
MLAAAGWDITFCHDRDDRAAVEVEKAASELGVRVLAVQAELTRLAEAVSWVQRAEEELGPVQAAVSCAGITRDRPLALLENADWRALTDTSLQGVLHLCQAVLPAMMQRQSGRIVAISSVSGAYGDIQAGDRGLPRAGIAAFTRALASQTRRYGIRVNAIAPAACGASSRSDTTSIWPAREAGPEGNRASLSEAIAVRRFASAAAVADRVAFLLSAAAGHRTGTLVEMPGGI